MSKQYVPGKGSRRKFLMNTARGSLAILSLKSLSASAETAEAPSIRIDHKIRSVPENMVWGYYGADVFTSHKFGYWQT